MAAIIVADAVREACGLDRVLFVPTREGLHYRHGAMGASADERATMLRLAIASNVAFAVDESDLDPAASGYTADLLPWLQALSGRPPDLHRRRRLARALALAPARRGAIAGCRTMPLYSICTSALYRCRI